MNISLRQRILLAVGPIILLIGSLGIGGVILLNQLADRSEMILRENYDSVRAMTVLIEEIESTERLLLNSPDLPKKSFLENWSKIEHQVAVEENNITILPEEPILATTLKRAVQECFDFVNMNFFGPKPIPNSVRETLATHTEKIRSVASQIRTLNENQMQNSNESARQKGRSSLWIFSIAWLCVTLVAILGLWWLFHAILSPIHSMTEAVSQVSKGELELVVPVITTDELGQLATQFNVMTHKLRAFRQTNQARLLRARQTGQATIDSFPDPVILLDLDHRVESANPAAQKLFGLHIPIEGRSLDWQAPESLRPLILSVFSTRQTLIYSAFDQALSFRIGGEERYYLPQIRPIISAEGEFLAVTIILHDITRFRILDQLKSDWLATVSHELKTPLTSIRLAVHVLLEEVVGPLEPKQLELLLEARENSERLFSLIEQLLSLARLEDEDHLLKREPKHLSLCIQEVLKEYQSPAEDKHIQLRFDNNAPASIAEIDSAKFEQAIGNLVENALRYTGVGGEIVLALNEQDSQTCLLTVSDNGVGIPAEYLPRVFERFFRVPSQEEHTGTGLGLAIVKEIIDAHGGHIRCESESGRGTTFCITMPIFKGNQQ